MADFSIIAGSATPCRVAIKADIGVGENATMTMATLIAGCHGGPLKVALQRAATGTGFVALVDSGRITVTPAQNSIQDTVVVPYTLALPGGATDALYVENRDPAASLQLAIEVRLIHSIMY